MEQFGHGFYMHYDTMMMGVELSEDEKQFPKHVQDEAQKNCDKDHHVMGFAAKITEMACCTPILVASIVTDSIKTLYKDERGEVIAQAAILAGIGANEDIGQNVHIVARDLPTYDE